MDADKLTMNLTRNTLLAGVSMAMVGSIAFSAKAIIVKLAYRYGVDAVTLIMYRMLFALPLFAMMAWWASRGKAPLSREDRLGVIGLGLCGYYLSSYLDFLGLQYISASLERLILYLNPTMVLILGALLFKRRISRTQAIAMVLSYGGVLLVLGHELSFESKNVLLGTSLVSNVWARFVLWAWPRAWPVCFAWCSFWC
jgi:drug/metabolite transporter (DMT)-like permease